MDLKRLRRGTVQAWAMLRGSTTPWPLIRDLVGVQSKTYIARNIEGHQVQVRPGTGQRRAFYENLLRQDYFRPNPVLRAGGTVVDVGANIGCFAIVAASRTGPDGRVIAIEPDPDIFAQLEYNVQLNGLANVTALCCAVGGSNQEVTLVSSENSLHSSTFRIVDSHAVNGREISVQSRRLVDILDEMDIAEVDLLKLDCEGAEYEILDSLSVECAERIKQIVMEVHQITGRLPREVQQRLNHLGYTVRWGYPVFATRVNRTNSGGT